MGNNKQSFIQNVLNSLNLQIKRLPITSSTDESSIAESLDTPPILSGRGLRFPAASTPVLLLRPRDILFFQIR